MIGGSALAENENKEGSGIRSLEDILRDLDAKLEAGTQDVSLPRRREPAAEAPAAPEHVDMDKDTDDEEMPARPIRRRKKKEDEEELSWQESLLMTLHDVVGLVAVVVIVFVLLFRIVVVNGSSMYNTLWHNDYLLVMSNVLCGSYDPGDIIVASKDSFNDGEPIIKRVIATEGQTVDIDFGAGVVYVDGEALEEEYTYTPTNVSEGVAFPLTVAEDCIFVMGDNRNRSRDSRYPDIGMVDEREVLGKAVFLIFPGTGDEENRAPRDFSRIGVLK